MQIVLGLLKPYLAMSNLTQFLNNLNACPDFFLFLLSRIKNPSHSPPPTHSIFYTSIPITGSDQLFARCPVSSCPPIITEWNDQHAIGGVQQGGTDAYNATTCLAACIASPTCLSIDFTEGACFFASAQYPPLFSLTGTDHYALFYPENCSITTGIVNFFDLNLPFSWCQTLS